jgi:hypothetical protein
MVIGCCREQQLKAVLRLAWREFELFELKIV